ncbi:MAPEG family protein [Aerosakkonemataceae cyanobacterium BLCC-F50]|uniref:MAPEG family protein n=1 Tax=Floridaenema flaviceps BLCC-F50 TaxID=3153642 RepID=A0ABV4XWY4_9CYAN
MLTQQIAGIMLALTRQVPTSLVSEMTFPLWGLVIFILWTIVVVILLLTVRIRHLAAGGSVKDFATQNDESLLWRLFRVQANLVENLPLYLGVVFLLTVRGVSGTVVDVLIVVYIAFRIIHSLIHIAGLDPKFRLLSLAIQLTCLVALTTLAIL